MAAYCRIAMSTNTVFGLGIDMEEGCLTTEYDTFC